MAHIEFDWIAKKPLRAEHPLGSGTIVEYQPGDRVPANDWGQAAHHLEANDKIAQVAINVADPGDDVAGARDPSPPPYGLSDPTRQFLAYEGQAPVALEEPTLEPDDGEDADETALADELDDDVEKDAAVGFPVHQGGGMYELSDGSTVRGKQRAVEAQQQLDSEE